MRPVVVGVMGGVPETVSQCQRGVRLWLRCGCLYSCRCARSPSLYDPPGVFLACHGHRRAVRGSVNDRPVCALQHNSWYLFFCWTGMLHQVVHRFWRQGVVPLPYPGLAFCRLPNGNIGYIHDGCQGVVCQGDDVVCKPFRIEMIFSRQGSQELGCRFHCEV